MPALAGRVPSRGSGAGVRKPPKKETASRKASIRRRELWGFEGRQRLLTGGRNDHRGRFRRIEGAQAVLSAGVGMMFFAAAVLGRVGRRTIGRAPAARSNDPQQKRGELRRCG